MNNINFNYTNLTPFKWFFLENFPFIDAQFDAMTNWQLFCKLGNEMNKIINSVNLSGEQVEKLTNAFNDLLDYVNNYFKELNVQEEINNKLDQMAEDGTLANIINQEIFGELNEKINQNSENISLLQKKLDSFELDGHRIGRRIELTHRYDNTPAESYLPFQMQGNCYTNNNTACYCLLDQERFYDSKCTLVKVNLNDMSILRSVQIDNSLHANWLSFNPDTSELYLTKNKDRNYDIIIIDFETFQIKRTINLNNIIDDGYNIGGFSYDPVTKKYYANTQYHAYEIDINNVSLIKKIDITWDSFWFSNLFNDYMTQGSYVYDNKIYYTVFDPNCLAVFDIDGNYKKCYNFKKVMDSIYVTREIEEVSPMFDKEDGSILIGSTGQICWGSEEQINQFFISNIKKNYGAGHMNSSGRFRRTIYVDQNSLSSNPNGHSDNKYKSLAEALDITFYDFYTNIEIKLADGNYYCTTINSPNSIIYLSGNSVDPTKVKINNLNIFGGNVSVLHLTLTDNYYFTDRSYILYANRCNLNINDVNFEPTKSTLLGYATQNADVKYGRVLINNSAFTSADRQQFAIDGSVLTKLYDEGSSLLPRISGFSKVNIQTLRNYDGISYGTLPLTEAEYNILTSYRIKRFHVIYSIGASDMGFMQTFERTVSSSDDYYINQNHQIDNSIINYQAQLHFDGTAKTLSITKNFRNDLTISTNTNSQATTTDVASNRYLNIHAIMIES